MKLTVNIKETPDGIPDIRVDEYWVCNCPAPNQSVHSRKKPRCDVCGAESTGRKAQLIEVINQIHLKNSPYIYLLNWRN